MVSGQKEQEGVLAEVAHDLANRFHRYYYCSHLAVEALGEAPPEVRDLLARAQDTVEEIEALTSALLAFVRPTDLRSILVGGDDVVGSLRRHLGEHCVESFGCDALGSIKVAVDPTRLGEVLATCSKILLGRAVSQAPLRLELGSDGCLELRLSVLASSPIPATPDLALAMAMKIVALHGGELTIPTASPPGTAAITVRLPIAPQE